MINNAVNDVLSGTGGRSAKFQTHGDFVVGEVVGFDQFQQRDIKTREPLTWPDGNPKMNIVVSLQTADQEDEDDDGIRNVYIKIPSQPLAAFKAALQKARVKGIAEGGILHVKYESTAKPSGPGMSGQKHFAFEYRPPTTTHTLPDTPPFCAYHHTDLIQSPKSGKWGHMVDGAPCFGLDDVDDADMPF